MTERLADIQARLENIRQLDAVVTAMRGIAAARVQQSRRQLAGIAAYSATISRAIGQAVGLVQAEAPISGSPAGGGVVILFGAEQGLAGGYSDSVLDSLGTPASHSSLMLIGSRCVNGSRERGLAPVWTSRMASQIGAVPEVAGRAAAALYTRIAEGKLARADVIRARLDDDHKIKVERTALFPLDLGRFPADKPTIAPLTTLPPRLLLEQLTAEYIYARLCEAAMQAFAAENQARMNAMSAASSNISRMLDEIGNRERQVRQEEVTAEIVELAAGERSSDSNKTSPREWKTARTRMKNRTRA